MQQGQRWNELMALAKEKLGALDHGSAGKGATQHLAALLFESMTGARLQHVFYRGAAAMLPDLSAAGSSCRSATWLPFFLT